MREEEREGSPAMAKDSGEGSGAAVGMDGGVMGIGGGGSTTAGAATDCSGGVVASLAPPASICGKLALRSATRSSTTHSNLTHSMVNRRQARD